MEDKEAVMDLLLLVMEVDKEEALLEAVMEVEKEAMAMVVEVCLFEIM